MATFNIGDTTYEIVRIVTSDDPKIDGRIVVRDLTSKHAAGLEWRNDNIFITPTGADYRFKSWNIGCTLNASYNDRIAAAVAEFIAETVQTVPTMPDDFAAEVTEIAVADVIAVGYEIAEFERDEIPAFDVVTLKSFFRWRAVTAAIYRAGYDATIPHNEMYDALHNLCWISVRALAVYYGCTVRGNYVTMPETGRVVHMLEDYAMRDFILQTLDRVLVNA